MEPIKATVTAAEEKLAKQKSEVEKRFIQNVAIAEELEKKALAIIITDEVSLSMANQLLSDIKGVENIVEKKRKELKAPFLEMGKTIDIYAKKVLDPCSRALATGTDKLRVWNAAVEAKKKVALDVVNKQRTTLDNLIAQITDKSDKCVTPEGCANLYASINAKFPALEAFGEFASEAAKVKEDALALLVIKQTALQKSLYGGAGSTQAIAAMKEAEKIVTANNAAATESISEKKEQLQESIEEDATKSKVRRTLKYEILNEALIPREWLMPDPEKIKEYMATLKDKQTALPLEIKGIKFYIDEAPIIRA